MRVVPGCDVSEDRLAEFVPGLPGPRVEEFSLQHREEALTKRVVVGMFDAADASEQAGLAEAMPEGPGGVITSCPTFSSSGPTGHEATCRARTQAAAPSPCRPPSSFSENRSSSDIGIGETGCGPPSGCNVVSISAGGILRTPTSSVSPGGRRSKRPPQHRSLSHRSLACARPAANKQKDAGRSPRRHRRTPSE